MNLLKCFFKNLSSEGFLNYRGSGSIWSVVSTLPQYTALYGQRHDHHHENLTLQSIFKPFIFSYLPSKCKFLPSDVLSTVIETEHESSDCILIQSTDYITVTILNGAYLFRLSILEYHSISFSCCRGSGNKVKTAVIKIYKTKCSKVRSCLYFLWLSFM